MTDEERDMTPALVALCPCCDRVQLVIATQEWIDKSEKEIASAAASGHTIKTVTVADAREMDWFCEKRRAAQVDTQGARLL